MNIRQHLYRGFHPCDNGSQTITLDGKQIKGEWVEGDLVHATNGLRFIHPIGMSIDTFAKAKEKWNYNVLPETVCEWTGLTDSKGNKVFEHDLFRFDDCLSYEYNEYEKNICEVIWGEYGWCFDSPETYQVCDIVANGVLGGEVIGTIFSDADLLGGEE